MITKEEIKKMSTIAKISINEMEAEKFADDLSDMFAFINMINEKDFDSSEFTGFCGSDSFFREDASKTPFENFLPTKIKSDIDISIIE